VIGFEESFDVPGNERKELVSLFRDHELFWNDHLGLTSRVGRIPMEHDGADSKICPTQINAEAESLAPPGSEMWPLSFSSPYLLSAVGNSSDKCRYLTHGVRPLLQADV
jgi:hypothetical protein